MTADQNAIIPPENWRAWKSSGTPFEEGTFTIIYTVTETKRVEDAAPVQDDPNVVTITMQIERSDVFTISVGEVFRADLRRRQERRPKRFYVVGLDDVHRHHAPGRIGRRR